MYSAVGTNFSVGKVVGGSMRGGGGGDQQGRNTLPSLGFVYSYLQLLAVHEKYFVCWKKKCCIPSLCLFMFPEEMLQYMCLLQCRVSGTFSVCIASGMRVM